MLQAHMLQVAYHDELLLDGNGAIGAHEIAHEYADKHVLTRVHLCHFRTQRRPHHAIDVIPVLVGTRRILDLAYRQCQLPIRFGARGIHHPRRSRPTTVLDHSDLRLNEARYGGIEGLHQRMRQVTHLHSCFIRVQASLHVRLPFLLFLRHRLRFGSLLRTCVRVCVCVWYQKKKNVRTVCTRA